MYLEFTTFKEDHDGLFDYIAKGFVRRGCHDKFAKYCIMAGLDIDHDTDEVKVVFLKYKDLESYDDWQYMSRPTTKGRTMREIWRLVESFGRYKIKAEEVIQ